MPPRRLVVNPTHPDTAALAKAGAVIRAGGLVAFPTETVYGLGANALDANAVRRIFAAKGRPANDPVIVHIAAREQVQQIAQHVPPIAGTLIDAFWPGPLTLVLPRAATVPDEVTAGLGTVAVRMPSHPVALGLIEAAGVPIAAPSANTFSRPSATTADHVEHDLGEAVDLILDGGPAPIGVESTIVDLSDPTQPVVLRPGGVTVEALAQVVPHIVVRRGLPGGDDTAAQVAPGQLSKHYSPRAPLVLVTGTPEAARRELRNQVEHFVHQGKRVGALIVDEDRDLLAGQSVQCAELGSGTRLDEVAERLFRELRRLDASGVDVIVARTLDPTGLGLAIADRLTRAAAGRIVPAGR